MNLRESAQIAREIVTSIPFFVITWATIYFGGAAIIISNQQEKKEEYRAMAGSLCTRVMEKYDKNNNGILDPREGVNMARDLGVRRTFPTSNVVANLVPAWNASEHDYSIVHLKLASRGSQLWNEVYRIPVSRLNEILKFE